MEASKDAHIEDDQSNDFDKARKLSSEMGRHYSSSKSNKSAGIEKTQHILVPSVGRSRNGRRRFTASFFQSIHLFQKQIPKHLMSVDENYLRRCLELIHITASEALHCNLYANSSSSKIEISACHFDSPVYSMQKPFDTGRLVFEYPLSASPRNVVISSSGPLAGETIIGSRNMLQVLKSPLLRKLGAKEEDHHIRSRLSSVKSSVSHSITSSPGIFSDFSPARQEKETPFQQNRKKGSEKTHRRLTSVSSTNSITSDPSSYSSSPAVSQGMLHVKWKEGVPHFVFSFDEIGEVYSAELCSAGTAGNCLYTFHMRRSNRKKYEEFDGDKSQLVGKMKVSESFSLCPKNSRIAEREFVLFACGVNSLSNMQTPYHHARRNKTLPKKVLEAFRNSHSRQRSISRFDGRTSSTPDYCLWEPHQRAVDDPEPLDGPQSLESDMDLPPNHEVAAVILKDHLPEEEPREVGGWGMKFLKKASLKQRPKDGESCPCCADDRSSGSVIMDVVVPMDIHGGPRTRNSGPSSLIERWRSGGSCDCGGWDLGCPLTVFKTQSTKDSTASQTASKGGDCKLFELFLQGSHCVTAGLRIVNVHEGLYFVQFQPRLSALQSFSIAVAYIHSQSPAFGNIRRR